MGRNLFILAISLAVFGLLSWCVAWTGIAHQPSSPGDASLWRTMGTALLLLALLAALGGILSSLFSQARRRAPGADSRNH